jgi:hypothetical protein
MNDDMTERHKISDSKEGEVSNDTEIGPTQGQSNGYASSQSSLSGAKVSSNQCEHEFKNDLLDLTPDPSSVDFARIARLSKYKFERVQAMDWAMHNMKYLVYDDTDIKINGYDSDDNNNQRMPYDDNEGQAEASSSKKSAAESPCRICPTYPEFPHSWKTRKFRVVNPTLDHGEDGHPVDLCQHYVAVSYCWPPQDVEPGPRSYQVRDLNGQVRPSRALDDVLDRAVDVANTCGLRMIWIDQECLPQPTDESSQADKSEQGLGIQAMDVVYNRAVVTAGMLDVMVDEQAQLDALRELMFFDETRIPELIDAEFCYYIFDILHRTSLDRWYTRAWVLQESLCAGDKLVLTFRRRNNLLFPSKFRLGDEHERVTRPYHSLDDKPRQLTSNVACVPLRKLWCMIDAMKYSLSGDFIRLSSQIARFRSPRPYNLPNLQAIIEAADSLHPRFVKGNTLSQVFKVYGPGTYGQRPIINAAGALTLLKYRQCRFDSDRLAIIANMCDYDFRLDTRAVEQNCGSLREAVLSLALNNGDTSLLVPEVYLSGNDGIPNTDQTSHFNNSCLFTEVLNDVVHIEHCRVRNIMNFKLQTIRPGWVTSAGLQLPAYIWSVDAFANFQPIQEQWADAWDSLKCWRVVVDPMKTETPEQFQARNMAITRRFSEPWVRESASREFKVAGHISNNSVIWNGIDSTGVYVFRHLDPRHVMLSPAMRDVLVRIVFDILRYATMSLSDTRHAQGLANSLWHSVRVDQASDSDEELPDSVSEALFSHKDVLAQPHATLQLDFDHVKDTFAQLWFVDRIMEQGGLWCGHYTRSWRERDLRSTSESPPGFSDSGSSSLARYVDNGKGKTPETNQPDLSKVSILNRQVIVQMIANYYNVADSLSSKNSHRGRLRAFRYPAAAFAYTIAYPDYHNAKGEERRAQNLVSAFDVDGPCLIATPYNPDWEILPRPELRSMSVCWIVNSISKGARRDEDKVLDQNFRDNLFEGLVETEGKGKGKAPQSTTEENNAAETKKRTRREDEDAETKKRTRREDEDDMMPAYQVLRKVKGLWQIMDLPTQEYIFS